MNRPGKQNYRRITERDEKPSIRYTALVDLHDLVMAITRRLVQTAIWMSESRQHVLELPMFSSKPIVRLDDAQAAVDALNMPTNSFDYWVKAPRRAGVKVLEYTTDPEPMSLDKVEEKLSHVPVRYMRRFKWDRSQFSGISAECNTSSQNKGEETEDEKGGEETEEEETEEWKTGVREKAEGEKAEEGETDEDSQEVSDTEISLINDDSQDDLSGPVSTHSKIGVAERRHDERQRTMEAEEDKYLERLDRKHAIKAEKELWRIMGFGELEHAEEEYGALSEDSEDPKAPRREGRRERRIPNWRSDVRYRAPWEQELEKRQREDGDADNNVGDALSHNMQAAMESITKRRKIANAPRKAVKLNTEAKRKSVAGKVKQEQKRKQTQEQPLPRSPRKQRNRRQSTAVPGFVSTVDAVSDVEAVVAEGVDDEDDEDEDLYQEEEE